MKRVLIVTRWAAHHPPPHPAPSQVRAAKMMRKAFEFSFSQWKSLSTENWAGILECLNVSFHCGRLVALVSASDVRRWEWGGCVGNQGIPHCRYSNPISARTTSNSIIFATLYGFKLQAQIFHNWSFLKKILFIFRQRLREGEREGEKHQCMVACHAPPTGGIWPTTHACALTRNWTSDPVVRRPALNPLSHTSQGSELILSIHSW